jgi:hypothetical protein
MNTHHWHKDIEQIQEEEGTINPCGYVVYYEGCSTFFKKGIMLIEVKENGDTITKSGNYTITTSPNSGYSKIVIETDKFIQTTFSDINIRNTVVARNAFLTKAEADDIFISKTELYGAIAAIIIGETLLYTLAILFKFSNQLKSGLGQFLKQNVDFKADVRAVANKGGVLRFETKQSGATINIKGTFPKGETGDTPDCPRNTVPVN